MTATDVLATAAIDALDRMPIERETATLALRAITALMADRERRPEAGQMARMIDERLAKIRAIVDDNGWWMLPSGDHLNMAEELIDFIDSQAERIAALEAEVARYRNVLENAARLLDAAREAAGSQ